MEVIKKGSDEISAVEPLACCYPAGTLGIRPH
jgi:hypothetical protein